MALCKERRYEDSLRQKIMRRMSTMSKECQEFLSAMKRMTSDRGNRATQLASYSSASASFLKGRTKQTALKSSAAEAEEQTDEDALISMAGDLHKSNAIPDTERAGACATESGALEFRNAEVPGNASGENVDIHALLLAVRESQDSRNVALCEQVYKLKRFPRQLNSIGSMALCKERKSEDSLRQKIKRRMSTMSKECQEFLSAMRQERRRGSAHGANGPSHG